MIEIDFSTITVPTPAAYDSADPHKQRENFYYVMNQILAQFNTDSVVLDIDVTGAIVPLQFNNATVHWGELSITMTNQASSAQQT